MAKARSEAIMDAVATIQAEWLPGDGPALIIACIGDARCPHETQPSDADLKACPACDRITVGEELARA